MILIFLILFAFRILAFNSNPINKMIALKYIQSKTISNVPMEPYSVLYLEKLLT